MQHISVIFVLPSGGGGGGSNSVVQEAMGLSRLGCHIEIAVDASHFMGFTTNYPELDQHKIVTKSYANAAELGALLPRFRIVVATTNSSVVTVRDALNAMPSSGDAPPPRVAYYVQDYEPLFYAPHSEAWQTARASYTLIPGAILFAKTEWLRNIVYANHGVRVTKVEPSIDHGIYYPSISRAPKASAIVAMLRPATPRRAPQRTVRILNILAHSFGRDLALGVFGCSAQDAKAAGLTLSPSIEIHGRLRRTDVPALLRRADMFLDLSDFQAFGRTGAECMACGCIPVLPIFGGVSEFALHGRNAYVVDTRSDAETFKAVTHFVGLDDAARQTMRISAMETASRFSVERAALSELKLFSSMLT